MKKKLIIGIQLLALSNLIAQSTVATLPFYEGFNYPLGTDLRPNDTPKGETAPGRGFWIYNSPEITSVSPVLVNEPWSNSKGLPKTTGNAIRFKAGLNDPMVLIPKQSAESGVLYASFLFRINTWTTSNEGEFFEKWIYNNVQEYVFAFIKDKESKTEIKDVSSTHVFFKRDEVGDGFTLGISELNSLPKVVYSPQKIKLGEDVLIVVKYKYDLNEGTCYMWLNPTVTATEPLATVNTLGDVYSRKIKSSTPIMNELNKVKFNRHSDSKTPDITVDELRVANTWREVVGLNDTPKKLDKKTNKTKVK